MSKKLAIVLLLQRVSVFVVMLMWTLDKFVRPSHAAKVYEVFYSIPWLTENLSYVIGGLELILIVAFLFGYKKRISYGLVLLLHAISTLSSYPQYLAPFEGPNLLFFAAWPMLACCIALYVLKDHDTLLTIE